MAALAMGLRTHWYAGPCRITLPRPPVGPTRSLLRQLRLLFADQDRALRATALAEASRQAAPDLRTLYTAASADTTSPLPGKTRQILSGPRAPRTPGNIAHS